jgi:hypothetical protein
LVLFSQPTTVNPTKEWFMGRRLREKNIGGE